MPKIKLIEDDGKERVFEILQEEDYIKTLIMDYWVDDRVIKEIKPEQDTKKQELIIRLKLNKAIYQDLTRPSIAPTKEDIIKYFGNRLIYCSQHQYSSLSMNCRRRKK